MEAIMIPIDPKLVRLDMGMSGVPNDGLTDNEMMGLWVSQCNRQIVIFELIKCPAQETK